MVRSYRDVVAEAIRQIREIEPEDLRARLGEIVVLDVRESDEFEQGAIPGAVLVPRGTLEGAVSGYLDSPDREVALYCSGGARSALAAKALVDMGYTNVWSLQGGFSRWKREGLDWAKPEGLSAEQRTRYSRHILLREVGEEGQVRLLDSKVLLVGAGGLGSPAAMYLAAAGVGTLGIVDDDVVDASNLQRQILHNLDRLGRSKVESARETLAALNPDVKIETHDLRLRADNALELLSGYDVIVDGGDNFPTRYLVNDASLHLRIPVVHGSIFRFEGQVSVFDPYNGPCYRCQYREPPPPELAPSCAEAGVLGVLPGIVGSIQAVEAIKLILGVGEPLVGRLLTYDSLSQEFVDLRIRRDPDCPACSDETRPPRLVDYDPTCAYAGAAERVL
jgi:molybdopterin/thiamine biosynthesis adenylyltransferase/rhodanese-related sulfurtransferase